MKYPRHLTAILAATAALGLVPLTASAQLPKPDGAVASAAETHAIDQAITAVNTLSATDSIDTVADTADLEPGAIRPVVAGDAATAATTDSSVKAGAKGIATTSAATTKTCHRHKAQ